MQTAEHSTTLDVSRKNTAVRRSIAGGAIVLETGARVTPRVLRRRRGSGAGAGCEVVSR